MKNIYIGIFEGSNKTYMRAEDEEGQLLGNETSDLIGLHVSINHAWEMIMEGVAKTLASSSIALHKRGYAFHVSLGIKYTEKEETVKRLAKKNESNGAFKTFIVKSDCYALALTQKPNHAVIIVDEGIVGNAITKTDVFKVGGWGFPFADKGSILWLGSEVYRYTLQWIDGSLGKPTPLLKAIYSHFNNDAVALTDWATTDFINKKHQYRVLSNMVLNFYNLKDRIAIDLIKKSASEVEKMYGVIKNLTGDKNIPLSLYGELVKYITPFLSVDLKKRTHVIYDGFTGTLGLLQLLRDQIKSNK